VGVPEARFKAQTTLVEAQVAGLSDRGSTPLTSTKNKKHPVLGAFFDSLISQNTNIVLRPFGVIFCRNKVEFWGREKRL